MLDTLDPEEILLFGVATNICDDAAARALLRRSRRIEARVAACTAAWREAGVRFTTAEAAAASLG
jgi:nicotinamidase-related amidase